MKTSLPLIHETAEELKGLLKTAREAQHQQRLQALYILQTAQARTRRQVAQLLGVSRNTVSRWLAACETGGIAKMLTIAKAPGKGPLVSPAIQDALQQRLAHPTGFARYKAIWQWLQHDDGLSIADTTVHRLVRDQLGAQLKVPRKSPRKKR